MRSAKVGERAARKQREQRYTGGGEELFQEEVSAEVESFILQAAAYVHNEQKVMVITQENKRLHTLYI